MKLVNEYFLRDVFKNKSGVYGIYLPKTGLGKYLYIGKSSDLSKRVFTSSGSLQERIHQGENTFSDWYDLAFELHIWDFNKTDMSIMEPWMINYYSPLLNVEYITKVESNLDLTMYIPVPWICKFTYVDKFWEGKRDGYQFTFFLHERDS